MKREVERHKDEDGYLITPKMVSKIFHRSMSALANDRWRNKGLPYLKLGKNRTAKILYDRRDVEKFIETHKINPVAD